MSGLCCFRSSCDENEGDIRSSCDEIEGDIRSSCDEIEGDIRSSCDENEGDIRSSCDENEGDIRSSCDEIEGDIRSSCDEIEGDIRSSCDENEGDIRSSCDENEGDIRSSCDENEGDIRSSCDEIEGDIRSSCDENEGDIRSSCDEIEGDIRSSCDENEGDIRSSCDEIEGDNVNGRIDTIDEYRVDDGRRHRRTDAPDYASSWEILPTELVMKILSYLPTRDRFMMQYVCRRFQDVIEMPLLSRLLWKEFVWPDFEPCHVCGVTKILNKHGEYVRKIFFPAHLAQKKILEMAQCCTQVTHLSLPKDTKLSLDGLSNIVHAMKCLLWLDVFTEGNLTQPEYSLLFSEGDYLKPAELSPVLDQIQTIIKLLEISANSVKELNVHVNCHGDHNGLFIDIKGIIEKLIDQGCHLPTINIYEDSRFLDFCINYLWWEVQSNSFFKSDVYQYKQATMNMYLPIPLQGYDFGPSVTFPFFELRTRGLLYHSYKRVFYLNEFNYNGTLRHTITQACPPGNCVQSVPVNNTTCLHSVCYIDLSRAPVNSDNLKQFAIVCPNLRRLNLEDDNDCLKDLQGLHAIVHTCENLEGINLAGISVSQVESFELLWALLSSLKKLTHLAIELCLMKHDDVNQQQLIKMFKTFRSLKALEISCGYLKGCVECTNTTDFLFSYFPSLTYCRMDCFQYSALTYAITNCPQLKYLYEKDARKESPLPSSSTCHLRQLCIHSLSFDLTDEFVKVLSAHGQLECVILCVNSITIAGITTLINNSPKLTSLHISMIKPFCKEDFQFVSPFVYGDGILLAYTYRIKQMFLYHKLFTVGSSSVCVIDAKLIRWNLADGLIVNSLWHPLE